MPISRHKVVYLDYVLRDETGQILEQTDEGETYAYIHGLGHFGSPEIEARLEGMDVGDKREFVVGPEEAFGMPDPDAIITVPRDVFPADQPLEVDEILMGENEDGELLPMRIVEVKANEVRVDANHPFAGKTLRYSVSIKDLRDATPEEVSHQHLHEGGHDHDHGHDHEDEHE